MLSTVMKRPARNNILPRDHLSASQINLALTDANRYVRKYIYGEDCDLDSAYIRLGKLVADVFDGKRRDPAAELMKELVPKYPKREFKISCTLRRGNDEFELIGHLDGWNPRKVLQGEYKTGRKRWTLVRAMLLLQLRIYALIHYKNTGKIPDQELTWMGTEFDDRNNLILTGEFETFHVKHSVKTMLETEAQVWIAFDLITNLVKREHARI